MKTKTREEIAGEYGITRRTLYNWLKDAGIVLRGKLLCPKEVQKIYKLLGEPGDNEISAVNKPWHLKH